MLAEPGASSDHAIVDIAVSLIIMTCKMPQGTQGDCLLCYRVLLNPSEKREVHVKCYITATTLLQSTGHPALCTQKHMH